MASFKPTQLPSEREHTIVSILRLNINSMLMQGIASDKNHKITKIHHFVA